MQQPSFPSCSPPHDLPLHLQHKEIPIPHSVKTIRHHGSFTLHKVREVKTPTAPKGWKESYPKYFSCMQLTNKVSHQSSVQVRTRLQPALRTHSFSSRTASLPSTRDWSAVQLSVMLFRSAFLLSSSLSTF